MTEIEDCLICGNRGILDEEGICRECRKILNEVLVLYDKDDILPEDEIKKLNIEELEERDEDE